MYGPQHTGTSKRHIPHIYTGRWNLSGTLACALQFTDTLFVAQCLTDLISSYYACFFRLLSQCKWNSWKWRRRVKIRQKKCKVRFNQLDRWNSCFVCFFRTKPVSREVRSIINYFLSVYRSTGDFLIIFFSFNKKRKKTCIAARYESEKIQFSYLFLLS